MTQQDLFPAAPVAPTEPAPRLWTGEACRFLQEKQRTWAYRQGLELYGSDHPFANKGEPFYTDTIEQNCPRISLDDVRDLRQGDGNELGGKARCVFSSSALVLNAVAPFRRDPSILVRALGLRNHGYSDLRLEEKFPVVSGSFTCPNVDAVLFAPKHLLAIESKFSEPFSAYSKSKVGEIIKPKYMQLRDTWHELPALREFLERPNPYQFLDAHQLAKHILGCRARVGLKGFTLLYLYYDAHGEEAVHHRREILDFAKILHADGISFAHRSYQGLLLSLSRNFRTWDPELVNYLTARYL